jgi:hypothetical protein
MDKLKEIIRAKIKEMSATGQGGASFSAGQGEGYTVPSAFNKNKNANGTSDKYYYKLGYKLVKEIDPGATLGPGPKAGPEGVKDNYYVKAFNYKPVPNKIKGSGLPVKKLWEEDTLNEVNEFQQKRLDGLDEIEKLLNDISPLVSNAKNETIELYSGNAGSYDITQPIEMVLSYLREVKQLLTEK